MPSGDEGQVEIVVVERAARVAGIDLVHPLPDEIGRELVHGEKLGARLLADAHRVACMILVPVGERHMGDASDRFIYGDGGILEGGVAGEKRIDQDAARAAIDTEAGMAEPGNLHAFHPLMCLS